MTQKFEAAESLADAQKMRERVAARATHAPWYAPAYGLGCGALVASAGLPQPWMGAGTAISLAGVVLLYSYWQNVTGLSVNGYRKGRTRTIAIALAASLVTLMILNLVLSGRFGINWAPIACGAAAAVIATLLSSAWDRAWRAQMEAPVE